MRILVLICTLMLAACSSPQTAVEPTKPQVESTTQETPELVIEDLNAWYENLNTLSYSEQVQLAMQVYNSSKSPQNVKERALYTMATREGATSLFAQQTLANIYSSADNNTRMRMERLFLDEVRTMPSSVLQNMAQSTLRSQETIFPWIVFAWEGANANLLLDNAEVIERLGHPQYYANPALFGLTQGYLDAESLGGQIINPKPDFTSACITLVLPTTGSYAKISNQIILGARAAQKELTYNNASIVLNIYDTEDPRWTEKVKALPNQCMIVGGPLRSVSLEKAYEAELLSEKAFFAFMSQLPTRPIELVNPETAETINLANQVVDSNSMTEEEVEEVELPNAYVEGENIWRFFTAPQDQIDTVLNFAKNELNITEFASFYPNDAYGTRMSTLFVERALEQDIYVNQIGYLYNSPRSWSRYAGDFLGSTTPEGGGLPEIHSNVQAFFFPDTWSNMEIIAPVMHYQGAVYLPFFGTSLWENQLSSKENLSLEYYDLTIFPGSWNKNSLSYGAVQLQNSMTAQGIDVDDWAAIGYDFVQMVSALNYNAQELNSEELNEKLFLLQRLAWAGAPFVWDEMGNAARKLFLFQPDVDGIKVLNIDEYYANYQLRIENVTTLRDFYEREKQRRLDENREEFFEEEQERMIIFEEEQRMLEFEYEKQRLLELEEEIRTEL